LSVFVLFAGCNFNARADLNCWPDGTYLDMFAGAYGGFFGYPDDLDNLVIGSRVGPLREVNLKFSCYVTSQTTWFGAGTRTVPGIERIQIGSQTYQTNPSLSNMGLGYGLWWHMMLAPDQWGAAKFNTKWDEDEAPYLYTFTTSYAASGTGNFEIMVPVRIQFYKINNNFQNTDESYIPANITANLFRFYVARGVTPDVTAGSDYTYTLNLTQFSSTKRVCTPLVDHTIQFEYITAADLQTHPVGPVEATTKTFDLTFDCPYMAYSGISFRMQPSYGVIDEDNGVVGIKSGTGYASGIGIQIQARDVSENAPPSSQGDPDFSANWLTIKPAPSYAYVIPALQYRSDQTHLNPATTNRTKVINFRARYYRLPGALTGGKVESAVIFHIIYN